VFWTPTIKALWVRARKPPLHYTRAPRNASASPLQEHTSLRCACPHSNWHEHTRTHTLNMLCCVFPTGSLHSFPQQIW
jgi:hypothetical protein